MIQLSNFCIKPINSLSYNMSFEKTSSLDLKAKSVGGQRFWQVYHREAQHLPQVPVILSPCSIWFCAFCTLAHLSLCSLLPS